jgi:hypothetical protein
MAQIGKLSTVGNMSVTTLKPAFSWKDRRPIAVMHVADGYLRGSKTNPATWLMDPTIDVTTEAGLQDFQKKMMAYADQAIAIMKDLNAQGMIVWEIDGGRFPQAMYMGSPDYAIAFNPELNYGRHGEYGDKGGIVADFFAKYRDAGFKVGVCIRPCEFNIETHVMEDSKDPYETLLRKAKYAHDTWGCRIFYIDTNTEHVGDFPVLPATVFDRLHKALPKCLFIPEHEDIFYQSGFRYEDYYLYTAPYQDGRTEALEIFPRVLENIPGAFQCVNVSAGATSTPEAQAKLVRSVKAGNILMIDAWWRNDQIKDVIAIYQAAGKLNT